jgi:serine/threonine protein phosphatase 1
MSWLDRLLRRDRAARGEMTQVRRPTIPPRYRFADPSARIAAIGDLHGRMDLMRQLATQLDELARDPNKHLIEVYLGDYVDRGPRSRATLDFLIERSRLEDREVICLLGNHEQALLAGLESDGAFERWLEFGGRSTIADYGVSPAPATTDIPRLRDAFRAAFPVEHVRFLKSLRLHYLHSVFLFVHAGLRPGVPLAEQTPDDMLWIRDSFLRSAANFGAVVVHGHTPTVYPEFRSNRIGIDTGAYYSSVLTCLLITAEEISVRQTGVSGSQAPSDVPEANARAGS